MSAQLLSQIGLWIAVLVLASVVLALARQIGVLHERLAPLGPLRMESELVVGQPAPRIQARSLDGAAIEVGAPLATAQLLFFVAADCSICKKVIPYAQSIARRERLDLLLVGVGEHTMLETLASQFDIDLSRFIEGAQVASAFRVGRVPYAVLLDPSGLISAMGLVDSREQLEQLLLARGGSGQQVKRASA